MPRGWTKTKGGWFSVALRAPSLRKLRYGTKSGGSILGLVSAPAASIDRCSSWAKIWRQMGKAVSRYTERSGTVTVPFPALLGMEAFLTLV